MSQVGVPSAVGSPRKPMTRAFPRKPDRYSRPAAEVHRTVSKAFFGSALIGHPRSDGSVSLSLPYSSEGVTIAVRESSVAPPQERRYGLRCSASVYLLMRGLSC